MGSHTVRAAGHVKKDAHEDHNDPDPVKHFDGRILSIGVEDSWALAAKLSLVAGISADWQTTTRAQDYQSGQVIDLLATCHSSGASCGDAGGVNPQAGLFYAVPTGQLRVTVSRKTRMPSLKDRYSYKFGTAVPNPDLRAEHDVSVEAGYQGTLGSRTSFQTSAFYARIDDLMQPYYIQANLSQMRNIGRASSSGIEIDVRTRVLPRVDIGASYTYLRRENLSSPTTPLVDTPRHKGRASVIGTIAPFLQVVGSMDVEAGRRAQNEAGHYLDAPSFAVVNAKAVWTIRRGLDAELGIINAFDKCYWLADGYPEVGRTVLATMRWMF
jgi:iron complex outermembrane receptor protein